MKREKISNIISNIDSKYVNKAVSYSAGQKTVLRNKWVKWGAVAACFALVAMIGIGVMRGGVSGNKDERITLNSGETLLFVNTKTDIGQRGDVAYQPYELTAEEVSTLFGDVPVTAFAYYDEESDSVVGLEGELNGVKLILSKKGINLIDVVIDKGEEKISKVQDVNVSAGYCIANNHGNKVSLYFATFEQGGNTYYLESGGLTGTEEATAARDELVSVMLSLINHGEIDFTHIEK